MNARKQLREIVLQLQDATKRWSELDKRGDRLLQTFAALIASFQQLSNDGMPTDPSEEPATFALDAENTLSALKELQDEYQTLLSRFSDAYISCYNIVESIQDVQDLTAVPKNESGMSIILYKQFVDQIYNTYLQEYGIRETMIHDLKFDMRSETAAIYQVVWKFPPYIDEEKNSQIFARVSLDT